MITRLLKWYHEWRIRRTLAIVNRTTAKIATTGLIEKIGVDDNGDPIYALTEAGWQLLSQDHHVV